MEIAPENYKTYKDMGDSYFALQDYEKDLSSYQELLKRDPVDIKALNNIAVIFMIRKNYSLAREYFSKVLLLESDYLFAKGNIEELDVKLQNNFATP